MTAETTADRTEAAPLRVVARRKYREVENRFMSLPALGFTAIAVAAIIGWIAFVAAAA